MLILSINPSEVPLQITAHQLDGTPKLDVVSGTVRVYSLTPTGEVELLPSTVLVGSGATWRYVWEPVTLAKGQYIVEFSLIDADDLICTDTEDLVVTDSSGGGGSAGWDDLLADHEIADTMGKTMNDIHKVIRKYLYGDRYKTS